jgi:tetratricopeptide (TPR) repeat protein/chitodextrinase
MKTFAHYRGVAAVVVLLLGPALVQAASWWSLDYPYRRSLTIPSSKASHLAGDEIATFTMYTGGLCKPDGSDLRVATHDGKEIPLRLLMVGPGDQVTLAFAVQPGTTFYHVYMGSAKPAAPLPKLKIQRGVMLETWGYEGGGVMTVDMVQKALDKSAKFIGRGFRPNIFNGHNPFGPENRIINVFTGYLLCPTDGEYTFGTSSHDASFLLVDDKLVVDYGGFHDVRAEVRAQGKVQLKSGIHKLTYYHVNGGDDPICVAAWKPPGADKIWTIGADSFTPVVTQVTVGPIEQYGKTVSIDFTMTQLAESFVDNRYYQRYSFQAVTFGGEPRTFQWSWDFGDGQVGKGESADHVYLLPGEYTVTAKTASGPNGPMKRTNRIFVSRPWDRVTDNEIDSTASHANIVSEYNYAALRPEAIAEATVLLQRCERLDAIIAAGDALMKKDKVTAAALDTAMPIYTETLATKGQRPRAVAALLQAAKMTDNVATQATMLSSAGMQLMHMGGKDDLEKALGLFDGVVRKYDSLTTVPAIRQAKIGMGDVWRLRGVYEKAKEAYTEARPKSADDQNTSDSISKGDYARHVEDYLRNKDFVSARDFLDKWEEAYPLDKLEGYWSLLKTKLCMAQDKPADAVTEASVLVSVAPLSNYAPQLLMIENEAYLKLKDPAKAKEALEMIVEKYKESPLAAEAAKKLR